MKSSFIGFLSIGFASCEYVVKLPSGRHIGLSVKGNSAFRVRLTRKSPRSPMVRPSCSEDSSVDQQCTSDAAYTVIEDYETGSKGISAQFGSVQVDLSGALSLYNSEKKLLTRSQPMGSGPAASLGAPHLDQKGGTRVRRDPLDVRDERACHRACLNAVGCEAWVFDIHEERGLLQSGRHKCWLMKNVNSWQVAFESRISGAIHKTLHLSTNADEARLYGGGAGMNDAMQLATSASSGSVINEAAYTPYYYSLADGYGALGVSSETRANAMPAAYGSKWGRISWLWDGDFDLFLLPAETLEEGTAAFYDLVGRPAVPPLYAFGFIASRWGWRDAAYIESVLSKFRSYKYPIDAFITDFEWFTDRTDYHFNPEGEEHYSDFGWNDRTFPSPRKQLSKIHKSMKIKMAGIRKPRMGNSATLRFLKSKGWLLHGPGHGGEPEGYAIGRGVNYSIPAARAWYGRHMDHYLEDGVDFWWNDEGEDDYLNFHWWNVAQLEVLRRRNATKRFFSINRAFSPGTARLGAAHWTGDVHATWRDLRKTPGMVLNWNLGGAPFTGCDSGGFLGTPSPQLLTRWYQVAAFLPIMRVHSTKSVKPHWPWRWGHEAGKAMRKALNLRYSLIPYHYSLAKRLYWTGRVYLRPMVMDFPHDVVAEGMTMQWMFGRILVAPVLSEHSRKSVYLPKGIWYIFSGTHTQTGPAHISERAALDEVPMYVQPGTIVVVGPVVQHTGAIPSGPLEVQVYTGADAAFDFYEDDGETINFAHERKVAFRWDDANFKLSWSASGKTFHHSFEDIRVSIFLPGRATRRAEVYAIGSAGSIDFSEITNMIFM